MIFVYKVWEDFCKRLDEKNIHGITAKKVMDSEYNGKYLVLKHDVETNVGKAYELAKTESKYHHCGVYYVQAYLLNERKNVELLQKIKNMGHEVSYHYDVLDSCKGDMKAAMREFETNVTLFRNNGFEVSTVCQHGNPIVERIGYTSNRDFFRNEEVQERYGKITDIMVDFKMKSNTDYLYFSDAGRKFKLIYDPINNDRINSEEKNISYDRLEELMGYIKNENCIISTHPHRWTKSMFEYEVKLYIFKILKCTANIISKVPILKKIMSRYYYLAKKI